MSDSVSPSDTRRRRLLFRATHRGTHENDLLIGGYVAARLHDLTEADMDALEEVMELPDADLADWLTGRRPIPAEVDSPMLRAIKDAAGNDVAVKDGAGKNRPGRAVHE
ncbi:FAD assembly factor SdhE [Limobrevibacterium gyesilva]|uniref:FAD assembly factor SdhE n=1 Tax=Limobrevibacterium gyesilva TaxID=2991712 RepID=A0AA41YIR4_9PROT|nr:succinate dehydrogenase assembly factor 2 [Limobrevibacterium gyesilva]MCW3473859.1 succinate dehydrogenase assembly factor 2 [Limobrevibacterium gyesilva]